MGMGAIVNLLLRVTDLLEAEGRVARKAVGDIAIGVAVLTAACVLAALACLAFAAAMVIGLATVMPIGWALAIVGAVLALAAWVVAGAGRGMVRPGS